MAENNKPQIVRVAKNVHRTELISMFENLYCGKIFGSNCKKTKFMLEFENLSGDSLDFKAVYYEKFLKRRFKILPKISQFLYTFRDKI